MTAAAVLVAPVLVADGLTKRYGGLVANDAVSMRLEPGEIRGLIGPNGAGKTTFVNLVTGIETPDLGTVRLGDTDVTGLPPHRIAERGLVRSFQHARAFPGLSVRENLLVPYMASPATSDAAAGAARADELLRLATLMPLADQPAGALSGGQRMLLMACAGFMIPGIKVYVLDEPFAGINPVVKDTLIELIRHENTASGITFLIVSHEMEIVRRLCPKVTVMIQGRVEAEGSLDEVAQREDVITAYLGRVSA
ncbi:MAG: ATP-binding cassette domain-containing protein [Alphaproteobacteria bacterium]|nr:ATP-binding cassette domain-containing protein [Alphaproteobacteria bacterium]